SPSGDYVAIKPDSGADRNVYVMLAGKGSPITQLTYTPGYYDLTFSSDGKYLAASQGSLVQIWSSEEVMNMLKATLRPSIQPIIGSVFSGASEKFFGFSADDKYIMSRNGNYIRLWQWRADIDGNLLILKQLEESARIVHEGAISDIKFWPQKQLVATISS